MQKMILFITLIFAFGGCSNDDDTSSCGCGDEGSVENKNGILYFVQEIPGGPNYYPNRFRIESPVDCNSVCGFYILCNENKLTDELKSLRENPDESIEVRFSGETKEVCEKTSSFADFSFSRIILSSIEKL